MEDGAMSSFRRRLLQERENPPSIVFPNNGDYIVTTDYKFYKGDEWKDGSNNVLGIAVITDECKFFIDPLNYRQIALRSNTGWEKAVDMGLFYTDDLNIAQKHYNGYENTLIAIQSFSNAGGFKFCHDTILNNGDNGYLGSLGEWKAVIENIEEIQNLLTLVQGVQIQSGPIFTATQVDENNTWRIGLDGTIITTKIGYGWLTRVFGKFKK